MEESIFCNSALYLVPNSNIQEIVMVTTKSFLGGFMYTTEGVLTLCDTSIHIFANTLGVLGICPIQSLLTTSDQILWFNDFMKSNTFSLIKCKPCKQIISQYEVNANEVINPESTLPPIALSYPGTVTKYYLNNIIITFYREYADEGVPDIPRNTCASGFLKNNSSTEIAPRSYIYQLGSAPVNLYPQENEINTSSACSQCSTCSECLWCNMCIVFFGLALTSNAVTTSGCASTAVGCGL